VVLNILLKVRIYHLNSLVQQQCLPNSLLGLDILCQAKSGMGKTAVFVLTVLNSLKDNPLEGSCLVLAHTRELAYQINKEFQRFSQGLNYSTMVIYGGESIDDQIENYRTNKPPIIVGTPGRVLALTRKGILDWKNCSMFILDECDKMLKELGKLGFLFSLRHESRCTKYLQSNSNKETGYDVLSHTTKRN
jgi:ATP-dependent RNA helicase UAP56/SUB2